MDENINKIYLNRWIWCKKFFFCYPNSLKSMRTFHIHWEQTQFNLWLCWRVGVHVHAIYGASEQVYKRQESYSSTLSLTFFLAVFESEIKKPLNLLFVPLKSFNIKCMDINLFTFFFCCVSLFTWLVDKNCQRQIWNQLPICRSEGYYWRTPNQRFAVSRLDLVRHPFLLCRWVRIQKILN